MRAVAYAFSQLQRKPREFCTNQGISVLPSRMLTQVPRLRAGQCAGMCGKRGNSGVTKICSYSTAENSKWPKCLIFLTETNYY